MLLYVKEISIYLKLVLASMLIVFHFFSFFVMPWYVTRQKGYSDKVAISACQNFIERDYPNTTWISMTVIGNSLEKANEMYPELYDYFNGFNSKGLKMFKTPIRRTRITTCYDEDCKTLKFTLGLRIPFALAENPPKPLDKSLFFEIEPAARYVSRPFRGKATDNVFWREAYRLVQLVKKDRSVDVNQYYAIWYDVSECMSNQNEVWIKKKPGQSVHGKKFCPLKQMDVQQLMKYIIRKGNFDAPLNNTIKQL